MRDHLVVRGQFVSADELRRYLQAADIFVSPYLSEAQVTSGALSYAMGAGAAVVSTPYWHAQELVSSERGRLCPFKDHAALSHAFLELLGSPAELRRVRAAAFDFARLMAWPRIGDAYFDDCTGRAIWALGEATEIAQDEGCRLLAREMLMRALPHVRSLGPRGTAQCILGLARLVGIEPTIEVRGVLDGLTAKLREYYRVNATGDWHWFEPALT